MNKNKNEEVTAGYDINHSEIILLEAWNYVLKLCFPFEYFIGWMILTGNFIDIMMDQIRTRQDYSDKFHHEIKQAAKPVHARWSL